MIQLADILKERIKAVGGKAELGRLLGVTGPAIYQYTTGMMPSFTFALKWKEAFGENLIDLMFEEDKITREESLLREMEVVSMVMEDQPVYKSTALLAELNDTRKKLIACMEEKEELKKFLPIGTPGELKVKHQKK